MSHLKNLKLAAVSASSMSGDPMMQTREKAVAALLEQKRMAEAKIAGQPFTATHIVRQKNAEGQRVEVEKPKRVRQSWFTDSSGKIFFVIRYAGKAIEFAKDKNAIEVGGIAELPGTIDTLAEAVRAGELDTQLSKAAVERSKQLRKAD